MINELILEQFPDAIIFADTRGRIKAFNKAAENILGFSKEQVIGTSLDIIIPEKLRKAHWSGFEQAIHTGKLKHEGKAMKTKVIKADGSVIYLSVSFSLVKDKLGEVLGSTASCREMANKNIL